MEDRIKEYINQCMDERFQRYVQQDIKEKIHKQTQWKRENPDKQRQCIKKYEQTEKGKIATTKRSETRNKRKKEASKHLTWEEKKAIQAFYKSCPKGYCVDHIVPLGRGGKHELSNLQYLTHEENFRKGTEIWQKIPEQKIHNS